jgi:large subunit ribosomal protein L25
VGVAIGVKDKGGTLTQIVRELSVRCLPAAIPDRITIDVSHLDVGHGLHVKDVPIPADVELLTDTEQVVATVTAPVVEEVAAPVEEEVAAPAAEEAPPEETPPKKPKEKE